jgi:hypothetical protein
VAIRRGIGIPIGMPTERDHSGAVPRGAYQQLLQRGLHVRV